MIRRAITIVALSAATMAFAHQGVKNPDVKARMGAMSEIGGHMKVIGEMVKGKRAFDAKAVQAAANAISDKAAQLPDLFSTEASDPKSEAKPAIWQNYEDFVMKAGDLEMAAWAIVQSQPARNDLGVIMRSLGKTCQACHEAYRK